MTDYREWLKSATGQRVTADEIATILGVSRATATRRLTEGLDAADIITVSRALDVNPVEALVDLDHLTHGEASDFLNLDGQLVETADEATLVIELAKRIVPISQSKKILSLEDQRRKHGADITPDVHPTDHDGTVTDWDDTQPYAADSSEEERATPDDYLP